MLFDSGKGLLIFRRLSEAVVVHATWISGSGPTWAGRIFSLNSEESKGY